MLVVTHFSLRSSSTPTFSTLFSRKMPMPRWIRRRQRAPPRSLRVISRRRQRCRQIQISATKRGTTKKAIPPNRVAIQKMKRALVRGGTSTSTSTSSSPNRLFTEGSLLYLSRPRCRRRRPRPRRRPSTEWISITANGSPAAESVSLLPPPQLLLLLLLPLLLPGEPAIIRALFCSSSPKITSRVGRLPRGRCGER